MKVKCETCGKEYKLEKGENPDDFQCECGGNLKSIFDIRKNRQQPKTDKTTGNGNSFTDWWNKQSTNAKAGIGLVSICCIGVILILIIVAMGGSDQNTSNSNTIYSVNISNATELETFNENKALESVKPSPDDAQLGFNVTDYGEKTINGITVFYNVYTDDTDNSVNGDLYFYKNNAWHLIVWKDVTGNPNKAKIEKEISDKINNI